MVFNIFQHVRWRKQPPPYPSLQKIPFCLIRAFMIYPRRLERVKHSPKSSLASIPSSFRHCTKKSGTTHSNVAGDESTRPCCRTFLKIPSSRRPRACIWRIGSPQAEKTLRSPIHALYQTSLPAGTSRPSRAASDLQNLPHAFLIRYSRQVAEVLAEDDRHYPNARFRSEHSRCTESSAT